MDAPADGRARVGAECGALWPRLAIVSRGCGSVSAHRVGRGGGPVGPFQLGGAGVRARVPGRGRLCSGEDSPAEAAPRAVWRVGGTLTKPGLGAQLPSGQCAGACPRLLGACRVLREMGRKYEGLPFAGLLPVQGEAGPLLPREVALRWQGWVGPRLGACRV